MATIQFGSLIQQVDTLYRRDFEPRLGHCACGTAGTWRVPVFGVTGQLGNAVWPGCPDHIGQTAGAPIRRADYDRLEALRADRDAVR